MGAWSVKPLISELGDSAFVRLKEEFAQTYKYIHSIEENNVVKTSIAILCSENHIGIMTREEISALIDSVFAAQMKDSHWLRRYMDNIVALLPANDEKKHIGYDERAELYYKRAHDQLPKKLDELLKKGKALDEVMVLDILRDQVHFVYALNNKWIEVGYNTQRIKDINLKLNGNEDAYRLWYHVSAGAKTATPKPVLIGGIKISPIVIPTLFPPANAFQSNERQLAILLTRILLCEALEQDE